MINLYVSTNQNKRIYISIDQPYNSSLFILDQAAPKVLILCQQLRESMESQLYCQSCIQNNFIYDLQTPIIRNNQLLIEPMSMTLQIYSKLDPTQQSNKMKINFDQIFSHYPNQVAHKTNSFNDSQMSTAQGNDSLLTNTTRLRQPLKIMPTYSKSSQFVSIVQSNQRDNCHYQYYKRSQLNDEQSQLQRKTHTNNINAAGSHQAKAICKKVTQRIYQPHKCRKKECRDLQLQAEFKQLQKISLPLGAPKRHVRSLTETCQMLKQPSSLHERLYMEHKERQLRNLGLTSEYEHQRKTDNTVQLYQNKQYLKTYAGFYSRLDQQVNRKTIKQQYYERNPHLGIKATGPTFQPNTLASKCSLSMLKGRPSILPRKQKYAIKGTAEMYAIEDEKLKKSLQGSLENLFSDKKQDMIKHREDRIIQGLCKIFQIDGQFCLNPEAVSNLSGEEFQLIFPVIQGLEAEQSLDIQDFQHRLRLHFANLEGADRLKLRHIVRKKAMKSYRKAQHPIEGSRNASVRDSMYRSGKKKSRHNDYLVKIQKFI